MCQVLFFLQINHNNVCTRYACVSEMAKLRDLQEKSKKMADKLAEAANKIDSWKSTCGKVKAGGEGISTAGGCM